MCCLGSFLDRMSPGSLTNQQAVIGLLSVMNKQVSLKLFDLNKCLGP